jgi:hypothetical protein
VGEDTDPAAAPVGAWTIPCGASAAVINQALADAGGYSSSTGGRGRLVFPDGLAFLLDERTVALEQSDGMTQVIVADPAAWMKRACQVAGRVLTEQEWAEHLGARPYAPACRE